MSNSNGSTLIQVMIAMAIFTIMALGMFHFISEQAKNISFLEDKLTKTEIKLVIQSLLMNESACAATLAGLDPTSASPISINELKDQDGSLRFKSHTVESFVELGQFTVINQSVTGPSSSGFVNITIPLKRTRSGGGPIEFNPLIFKLYVFVDAASQIVSCHSNTNTSADCSGNPLGVGPVYPNGDTWAGFVKTGPYFQHTGTPVYVCTNGSWIYAGSVGVPGP